MLEVYNEKVWGLLLSILEGFGLGEGLGLGQVKMLHTLVSLKIHLIPRCLNPKEMCYFFVGESQILQADGILKPFETSET